MQGSSQSYRSDGFPRFQGSAVVPRPVTICCADGANLAGHYWPSKSEHGLVVINPATGVLARYYHRFAAFLAERGFAALTYDYRGIGASRSGTLRGSLVRWSDWGTKDFAAALGYARGLAGGQPAFVVGHSFGGFIPGLAPGFEQCQAMLTVGAQYAYWRDYAASPRWHMFLKWHVAMPAITALCGYFPGRALGWLEDLPAGVAYEWAFRAATVEQSFPAAERSAVVERFGAYQGPILAISAADDPYATPAAIDRALSYYVRAQKSTLSLSPKDLGFERIGHFDLFHDRHRAGFWTSVAEWLESGGQRWNLGAGLVSK